MEARDSSQSRRLSPITLIVLVVVGLGILFVAVLIVELATGSREGSELLPSPRPLIPESIEGFAIQNRPELASQLLQTYRSGGIPVTAVEAAEIGDASTAADLSGAVVGTAANPTSQSFRARVLIGAAVGYAVPGRPQFGSVIRNGLVVYTHVVDDGRLSVWFFKDAFIQLFVPNELVERNDEILDAVLDAQIPGAKEG